MIEENFHPEAEPDDLPEALIGDLRQIYGGQMRIPLDLDRSMLALSRRDRGFGGCAFSGDGGAARRPRRRCCLSHCG
jgi:hypothetical protein